MLRKKLEWSRPRGGGRRAECGAAVALGVSLAWIFSAPAGATDGDCTPWPGEFSPLPDTRSRDPFAAQWAALRARELGRLAQVLEADDPLEAHRVWRHVSCLDLASEAAHAGLDRTRPQVLRPQLVSLAPPAPSPSVTASVTAPRPQAPPRASRPPAARLASPPSAPEFDFSELDASIEQAQSLIFAARFEEALASIDGLSAQMAASPPSLALRTREARLIVLVATIQLAFGREDAAQVSFARALEADPELRLGEATHSPKLRRAFDAARTAAPPHVAAAPPPALDFSELDASIEQAQSLIFAARFEEALASVDGLRAQMTALEPSLALRAREARLNVLVATVQLAFGREDAAEASFTRALAADPGLHLDETSHSPKVRRAYDAARGALASAR